MIIVVLKNREGMEPEEKYYEVDHVKDGNGSFTILKDGSEKTFQKQEYEYFVVGGKEK